MLTTIVLDFGMDYSTSPYPQPQHLKDMLSRLANSGFGHSGIASRPSPPSFSPPPSLSPGAPPLNQLGGLGEHFKLPQWGLGRSPSRQTIWCISEPGGAALVATVFVHFHKNKFKFLYKHKTALSLADAIIYHQCTLMQINKEQLIHKTNR